MNVQSLRRAFAPWLILLILILAASSALPFLGHWHWLADLFAHFVPHYLAAGTILIVALVWTRRYGWTAVAAAIVLWNGSLLSPYLLPQRSGLVGNGASLKLLQFNMSRNNPVPLATLGYVMSLEEPPDVVILFETTPALAPEVKRLNQIYPTIAQMPRSDNFGMALLSRLPASKVEFREVGKLRLPLLVLSGRVGRDIVQIYAVHPPPPLGSALSRERNDQLRQLAVEISVNDGQQVIVAGDLNTTVWSRALNPLLETAGLRDAQRGQGYLPTWAPPPYTRWIGVPIDHTLISKRIQVQDRFVGPWLASDHWPVHSHLVLRQ